MYAGLFGTNEFLLVNYQETYIDLFLLMLFFLLIISAKKIDLESDTSQISSLRVLGKGCH